MLRRPPNHESAGDERWLISYADFITLLFAFFVVMYAVTRSNQVELSELSKTLSAAFVSPPRSMEPIQVGDPLLAASPHVIDASDEPGYADLTPGNTEIEPRVERLMEQFAGIDGIETPEIASDRDWLEISLSAEVLFPAGSATLRPQALPALEEVAAFLGEFDNPVTIEGYTDNVPVTSARFPSNWELSAFRASVVARFLEGRGIERSRISAVGYGENHPVETNATPEGRARNRRVDIIVARHGNLGRNRNAVDQASAFAHVRQAAPAQLDDTIRQVRKSDGGLLFTIDEAADGTADDSGHSGSAP